jgi:hypothetical protein
MIRGIPVPPTITYRRDCFGGRCLVISMGFSRFFLYAALISSTVQRVGDSCRAPSGTAFMAQLIRRMYRTPSVKMPTSNHMVDDSGGSGRTKILKGNKSGGL